MGHSLSLSLPPDADHRSVPGLEKQTSGISSPQHIAADQYWSDTDGLKGNTVYQYRPRNRCFPSIQCVNSHEPDTARMSWKWDGETMTLLKSPGTELCLSIFLLLIALQAALTVSAVSQAPALPADSSITEKSTRSVQLYGPYVRPTQDIKIRNYLFTAFGPYPIATSAVHAAIDQVTNTPPEWDQGIKGYSSRLASNYGISMVATTTRYGLSEAFKQDAMYYRCNCTGLLPRVRHALTSTLTARSGEDGHRVFSIPALIGPYAGSMTATYGWYPNRYGAKDALRMGNYSLLAFAAENISLEFIYHRPHALLSRMHLSNPHASPIEGPNK